MRDALHQRLDAIIAAAQPQIAPAATLAVYHRGEFIVHAAWGWLDPEIQRHPVTTGTLFDLASLTKLFTTTAFLSLASRENIDIRTPLADLLPEFAAENPRPIDGGQDPHSKMHLPVIPELAGQTVDARTVTLWHLLTHTSGLPPWRDVYNIAPAPVPPDQTDPIPAAERWQSGLARMVSYPFVDKVDANIRYSDIGLMLLGEVAARLNQSDLQTAVQAHALDPIELKHVVYNPVRDHTITHEHIAPTEIDPNWRQRRVWGEVHDENACGLGGVAGHAGLFGTAMDVARFGLAWLRAEYEAISPELRAEAIREQAVTDDERRGLGWMLRSAQNSSAGDYMCMDSYGHTGFTGTSLWIEPEQELVAALLTNRVYVGRERPGVHELRRAINNALMEAIR